MKVIVTGSASPLALALLPTLASDERIEQLIGVDREETAFDGPRFTQVLLDPRSPQISRVIAQAEAVVHLASAATLDVTGRERIDRGLQNDLNVHGTQNLFRSALEHGVSCFVHVSTAAVYALPPRQRPITEQHPRSALSGFPWSEDMVALEEWLETYDLEGSETRVVTLRPALIVGRHASPSVHRLLHAPFAVRLANKPPRLQCVHIDDIADAILHALFRKDTSGVFNLACNDSATLTEMQRLCGRGFVPVPYPLVYRMRRLANRFSKGIEPAWMEAFRHELVLDTSRARRRLGWKPRYDTVEACLRAKDE